MIEPVSDGLSHIISQDTGRPLVMKVDDSLQFECYKWEFEPSLDGYYGIITKYDDQDKCLDVQACSSVNNIVTQKWLRLNSDCQSWKLDWVAPTFNKHCLFLRNKDRRGF